MWPTAALASPAALYGSGSGQVNVAEPISGRIGCGVIERGCARCHGCKLNGLFGELAVYGNGKRLNRKETKRVVESEFCHVGTVHISHPIRDSLSRLHSSGPQHRRLHHLPRHQHFHHHPRNHLTRHHNFHHHSAQQNLHHPFSVRSSDFHVLGASISNSPRKLSIDTCLSCYSVRSSSSSSSSRSSSSFSPSSLSFGLGLKNRGSRFRNATSAVEHRLTWQGLRQIHWSSQRREFWFRPRAGREGYSTDGLFDEDDDNETERNDGNNDGDGEEGNKRGRHGERAESEEEEEEEEEEENEIGGGGLATPDIPSTPDGFLRKVSSPSYKLASQLEQALETNYDVLDKNPWVETNKPVYVLAKEEAALVTMRTRWSQSEVEKELDLLFPKRGSRRGANGQPRGSGDRDRGPAVKASTSTKQTTGSIRMTASKRSGKGPPGGSISKEGRFRMHVEDVREGVLVFEDGEEAARYCNILEGAGVNCMGVAEINASEVFALCQRSQALAVLFRQGATPPPPNKLQMNLKARKWSLEEDS